MLTPKQEEYCRAREILKLSQRQAYYKAYPKSKEWKPANVDNKAYELEKKPEILARLEEIREEEKNKISQEAEWARQNAFKELYWLISKAKEDIENKGELSSPAVSAITNSVKELNTIYSVAEKSEGGGVLDDILSAVRGISND